MFGMCGRLPGCRTQLLKHNCQLDQGLALVSHQDHLDISNPSDHLSLAVRNFGNAEVRGKSAAQIHRFADVENATALSLHHITAWMLGKTLGIEREGRFVVCDAHYIRHSKTVS